jgi:hypothetical protein
MQYQNHVQSLNVMFVKRHENIMSLHTFLFYCYSCWIDCLLLKFGSYIIFIRPKQFWGRMMVWHSRRRLCTFCFVIFWQLVIIGTGNWHIDLEMGTLLHVSCAGISRDLRKSSTPSLSGNRSLNTVSVCELDSACSSNELSSSCVDRPAIHNIKQYINTCHHCLFREVYHVILLIDNFTVIWLIRFAPGRGNTKFAALYHDGIDVFELKEGKVCV